MQTYHECIPMILNFTLDTVRIATDNPDIHERVLRKVLRMLAEIDFASVPTQIGQRIYHIICRETGSSDPYDNIKRHYNQLVLNMLPELRKRISMSDNPFDIAMRLALNGNIIDIGIGAKLTDECLLHAIEQSLTDKVFGESISFVQQKCESAQSILYIGDNAGEIGFDRLLIERIGPEKVTFVVRGGPILNDVTYEDADALGLSSLVKVIDTNSDTPGLILGETSQKVIQAIEQCDLVLAKGQGNYASLTDIRFPTFFLFRAKCPILARLVSVPQDSLVIEGHNVKTFHQSPSHQMEVELCV
jgi:hypothetical protein